MTTKKVLQQELANIQAAHLHEVTMLERRIEDIQDQLSASRDGEKSLLLQLSETQVALRDRSEQLKTAKEEATYQHGRAVMLETELNNLRSRMVELKFTSKALATLAMDLEDKIGLELPEPIELRLPSNQRSVVKS